MLVRSCRALEGTVALKEEMLCHYIYNMICHQNPLEEEAGARPRTDRRDTHMR